MPVHVDVFLEIPCDHRYLVRRRQVFVQCDQIRPGIAAIFLFAGSFPRCEYARGIADPQFPALVFIHLGNWERLSRIYLLLFICAPDMTIAF